MACAGINAARRAAGYLAKDVGKSLERLAELGETTINPEVLRKAGVLYEAPLLSTYRTDAEALLAFEQLGDASPVPQSASVRQ